MSDSEVEIVAVISPSHNHNRKRKQRSYSSDDDSDSQPNKRRRLEDDEETQSEDLDIDYDDITNNSNNAIASSLSPSPIISDKPYIPADIKVAVQSDLDRITEKYLSSIHGHSNNNNVSIASSVEEKDDTENDSLKLQIESLKKQNEKLKNKLEKEKEKNQKLKIKCTNKQNQNERLETRIYKLKHEMEVKEHEYLLRIKGLAHRIINGPDPRFKAVKMFKQDMKYSQRMHQLKKKLWKKMCKKNMKYSQSKHALQKHLFEDLDDSINNQDIEIMDIQELKNQTASTSKIKKAIKKYLQLNGDKFHKFGLDQTQPQLLIDKESQSLGDVLEEFDITTHRISQLYGQKGVRTLTKVPCNTCLGQYVGVYRTKSEYKTIFDHSNQIELRDQYSYDIKLSVDNKTIDCIIDGFGLESAINERCIISMINDCRKDINDEKPSEEDKDHQNVVFVQAKVHGWPAIFVISTKDIEEDQELLGWYGDNFGMACAAKDEFDKFKRYMRTLVNDKMLKDLPDIKVYDLTSDD